MCRHYWASYASRKGTSIERLQDTGGWNSPAKPLCYVESAKMPSSHCVIQGYNAQVLVDGKHQVIVPAETFGNQDHDNLDPMLKGAKKNLQSIGKSSDYFKGRQFTADSNYYSHANLALCQLENLNAYIPDMQFRKRDERFREQHRFKNGVHPRRRAVAKEKNFTAADFVFDQASQVYLCPQPTQPLPGL
ncbi:MAG TPA: hypothetical protein VLA72_23010 [Anaerolineales bacterium]|nr:hypothetical protein [Anaerolineales bacterium]